MRRVPSWWMVYAAQMTSWLTWAMARPMSGWVGRSSEPVTLTFTLDGEVDIASVGIGIYHRDGLGIFVPGSVIINGVGFDLGPDDVPDNQRKDLVFSGPFTGPEVQVVLHHRGRGWIMLDEVQFFPVK